MTDLDGNEALLHLLDESWNEQQRSTVHSSKWTRDYLARLASLSLDELLREPADLRVEQEKLRGDAQQLAFHDYPAFIHANTCRHQVDSTLDELEQHLDGFASSVPGLQEACQAFADSAADIAQERSKITRVLEQQNVLVDLLEIPQLMETCVWNGYYSEAMDLASHVRLLLVRYPLPIVQSIQRQVQASVGLMLVQLVSHLRRPIKLAAAMNVMGHLRRMDAFDSEIELRMVFLRCRHDYLTQRLERIKRSKAASEHEEAVEYVKRYIDVMREQMFEIATQYMSIFSQQEQQSILILSDYMIHLLGAIQAILSTELPKISDTSALASLLTQLQYCGMSLGRVGIDFRHLFAHAFEDTVRPIILKAIDRATEDLVAAITTNSTPPNSWMLTNRYTTHHRQRTENEHNNTHHNHQPPMLLVDYPPLAVFTNAILAAFNALRLLPAISLLRPVSSHLDACFLEIGSALKQYVDTIASSAPNDTAAARSFILAYVRCCVPFLHDCLFNGIYVNIQHDRDLNDRDLETLLDVNADDQLDSSESDHEDTAAEKTEQDQRPSDDQHLNGDNTTSEENEIISHHKQPSKHAPHNNVDDHDDKAHEETSAAGQHGAAAEQTEEPPQTADNTDESQHDGSDEAAEPRIVDSIKEGNDKEDEQATLLDTSNQKPRGKKSKKPKGPRRR